MENLDLAKDSLKNLLKLIDETCRKHNITYWIDGGTLLGVARYNAFIPWDDDIDVCLLSDDYDKLIHHLEEDFVKKNKHYFFHNIMRPFSHWSHYFSDYRVVKNKFSPYKIDILRIKSIENTEEAIKKDKSIINIASFFAKKKFKHPEQVLKSDFDRFIKKGWFKKHKFTKYLINYVKQNSRKEEGLLYSYPYNDIYVKSDRAYYDYSDIFPVKEVDFEGIKVFAPNNVEVYLTKLYGEHYLSPPPVEYQKSSAKAISKNTKSRVFIRLYNFCIYFLKELLSEYRTIKLRKKYSKTKFL